MHIYELTYKQTVCCSISHDIQSDYESPHEPKEIFWRWNIGIYKDSVIVYII